MRRFVSSVEDLIFKRQRLFLILSLMLIFISISFKFDKSGSKWIWNDYPYIAVFMVIIAVVIVTIWFKRLQEKLRIIQDQIRLTSPSAELLSKLSKRQREVFDLIVAGKSNKEITQELYIELSTLKTHINHIYKTLDIKNRKEALQLGTRSTQSSQP